MLPYLALCPDKKKIKKKEEEEWVRTVFLSVLLVVITVGYLVVRSYIISVVKDEGLLPALLVDMTAGYLTLCLHTVRVVKGRDKRSGEEVEGRGRDDPRL